MYEQNSGRAPSQCNNEAARIVFVSNLHCFIQAWSPFRRKSELRYPLSSNSLTIVCLPRRKRKIVLTWNEFSLREISLLETSRETSRGIENARIREMTMKLHYRSRRNFSADTINSFDAREYHVGHGSSCKSPYTSVFFIRTIIRAALKARKRSKSDLAVDGARLTSGNRWLEWHLKLLKGSPYRSQPFTPSPEGRLSQWTRV